MNADYEQTSHLYASAVQLYKTISHGQVYIVIYIGYNICWVLTFHCLVKVADNHVKLNMYRNSRYDVPAVQKG